MFLRCLVVFSHGNYFLQKKKESDGILFTQLGYIFIKIYKNYKIILMFFSGVISEDI